MRIQIVTEGGEVVSTKHGLNLEAEIAPHTTIPRYRPLLRRRRKVLVRDLVGLLGDLRHETRLV